MDKVRKSVAFCVGCTKVLERFSLLFENELSCTVVKHHYLEVKQFAWYCLCKFAAFRVYVQASK